jgi:hypothetical protein
MISVREEQLEPGRREDESEQASDRELRERPHEPQANRRDR